MNIFLRDLPNTILLDPTSKYQSTILYIIINAILCILSPLGLPFVFNNNTGNLEMTEKEYSRTTLGYNFNVIRLNFDYVTNAFGLLLVVSFFNVVYKKYPKLAIFSLAQAYYFNNNFTSLFVIQALNRLAYAFYGLNYEDYRNKEDIKTRSIIEDFHSILGHVLVLPAKTIENEGTVWKDFSVFSNDLNYEYDTFPYLDIFIEQPYYKYFSTDIYEFILPKKTLITPFFFSGKDYINKTYGEFRPLRNVSNNSTYLHKTWIKQPQNCEYEEIEIDLMGIKNTYDYKELGLPYNPSIPLDSEQSLKLENLSRHSNHFLTYFPKSNSFFPSLENKFSLFSYPEELLSIWKETAMKFLPYIDEEKRPENPIFNLQIEGENKAWDEIKEKIKEAEEFIFTMHHWFNNKEEIEIPGGFVEGSEEYEINKTIMLSKVNGLIYIINFIKTIGEIGENLPYNYRHKLDKKVN